jgi:hypothetical protein
MITSPDSFKVVARSVEGSDTEHSAADAESALTVAQSVRTPANRMVKIFDDGFVTHRWDRTNTPGENRWRKVDPSCRIPDDHMVACEKGAGGSGATLSSPASAYCS